MKANDPVTGRCYLVDDQRKVKFEGECLGCEGGWADFRITGKMAPRLVEHGWKTDDKIAVRISFCKFYLVPLKSELEKPILCAVCRAYPCNCKEGR